MQQPEFKSYRFEQPAHWRAGALDNLEIHAQGLAVPGQLASAPVTGTGPEDATPALAFTPGGDLYWVRDTADPCAESTTYRTGAGISIVADGPWTATAWPPDRRCRRA